MLKKLSTLAIICGLLSACAGPAVESLPQYQANYKVNNGVKVQDLTDQELCNAIEPGLFSTYPEAVAEAQKRGLTKCHWK